MLTGTKIHYKSAFVLIHFDHSAEQRMQMFGTFFCATQYFCWI